MLTFAGKNASPIISTEQAFCIGFTLFVALAREFNAASHDSVNQKDESIWGLLKVYGVAIAAGQLSFLTDKVLDFGLAKIANKQREIQVLRFLLPLLVNIYGNKFLPFHRHTRAALEWGVAAGLNMHQAKMGAPSLVLLLTSFIQQDISRFIKDSQAQTPRIQRN